MDKTVLNMLKVSKDLLIRRHDSLLLEYREYQSYFKKEDGPKAKHEANMRYYCYMMDLLEVGPYEEGRFSLEHVSLTTCMEENKAARKRITEQIKEVKGQTKEFQQTFNKPIA